MTATVRSLHHQAMIHAQDGEVAKIRGEHPDAVREHYAKAYPLEVQALEIVQDLPGNEPTWSILCISAASLAAHAGLYFDAEWWIAEGWKGDPPPRQQRDLREVAEWLAGLKAAT